MTRVAGLSAAPNGAWRKQCLYRYLGRPARYPAIDGSMSGVNCKADRR
jgi:hypothetical protein